MMTKEFKDRITVLTIAYHNLAVEQEFMHTYEEALQSYKMAKNFALKYLGPDDPITHNLNEVYEKAKLEIEVKIKKQRN